MLKRRKVGRPKLPKNEAKKRIVPVCFTREDLKAMEAKAREKDKLFLSGLGVPSVQQFNKKAGTDVSTIPA